MSFSFKIKFAGFLCLILITCYVFFFRTDTITGRLMLIVDSWSGDTDIKIRTSQGEIKELFLADKGLLYDSIPNKIISDSGKSQREVSVEQFLEDIKAGGDNVPDAGIPVTINYKPNVFHQIFSLSTVDGTVKEVKYVATTPDSKDSILVVKEVSRKEEKPFSVTYSYTFNGEPPDIWYVLNGDEEEIERYLKKGDKFTKLDVYSSFSNTGVIKFKEEMRAPGMTLINFAEHKSGTFQIQFPDKEALVENSYHLISDLKNLTVKDHEEYLSRKSMKSIFDGE